MFDIAIEGGVPPRTGAIINPRRRIGFGMAVERLGGAELNFPERHPKVRIQLSRDIDFGGIGQRLAALRLKRILACNHNPAFLVWDFGFLSDFGLSHRLPPEAG